MVLEGRVLAVHEVEPVVRRHPEPAGAVLQQAAHAVVAEAGRVRRVVAVDVELIGAGIAPAQAAAVRAHPQAVLAVH